MDGWLIYTRKFWQNYLPSLKYHNPQIEMDVVRTSEIGGSATLTIEFGNIYSYIPLSQICVLTLADSASAQTFELKDRDRADIYAAVLEATKATPIPMTEEDNHMILAYEELKKRIVQRAANRKARIAASKLAGRTMNISPLVQ